MHYTSMMAFIMPISMSYSVVITCLSLLPIFIGSYFTLKKIALKSFDFINIQLAALAIAIGMEAMLSAAVMKYDLVLFITSIAMAYILATVTLYLIILENKITHHHFIVRMFCSIAMGGTVSAMHYTAMISASFYFPNNIPISLTHAPQYSWIIPIIIAGIIAFLVVATIIYALIDKRLQATELSAKESAIRENNIVENLPDCLLIIDTQGQIVLANSAAQIMFNMSSSAIKALDIEQLIPEITYSKLVNDITLSEQVLLGKTLIIEGLKKNGETFPIEAHFSKMTLIIDLQVMFSCVMRDISERVQFKKKLNQANKLESIGQLAAGIAHEINTPAQYVTDNTTFLETGFNSCIAIIKLCQKITNTPLESIVQQDLDKINDLIEEEDLEFILEEVPTAITQSLEGLHRISTIVKAMKSFSHPSKGEMQSTSIIEALATTITVARSEWRYIAELSTAYEKNLPHIMCIRDELNQVFLNIIVNAAHAIDERVKHKPEQAGKIQVLAFQQATYIIIKIIDNGTGMTAEVQERIFDPFYTTKTVGKGTGQGLSSAYSIIVDRHKGKIEVNSVADEGTTFVISLPIESTVFLPEPVIFLEQELK